MREIGFCRGRARLDQKGSGAMAPATRQTAKSLVPHAVKRCVRKAVYPLLDAVDLLTGRRDELTPPRRMIFVGAGDFRRVGEEFMRYFVELGGLQPTDRVLDAGCGIGRMAVPLTGYLRDGGSYEGFDIVESGVDWCRRRITPRFPHFRFRHADIHNRFYNRRGRGKPEDFAFPYADGEFDFALLTSVFTHMLPDALANYVSELARVVKPGGRCFATFFLLGAPPGPHPSTIEFAHAREGCRIASESKPEAAVAYDESRVRELLAGAGFEVVEPVRYGSWCGRDEFLTYQDVIVSTRR
jgi:SAM-dependent methyltransferase